MSKELEVEVEDPEGHPRTILVKDYDINWGRPGHFTGPPEDCYPSDPTEVNDVNAWWDDNTGLRVKLTDSEYEVYQDIIEEAIINDAKGDPDYE